MASFQIHEDIKNAVQLKQIKLKKTSEPVQRQKKPIFGKKFGLEARTTKPLADKCIKQDKKRVKFNIKNDGTPFRKKSKPDVVEKTLKVNEVSEQFLNIDETKTEENEAEKNNFPLCLLHEHEYRKDIFTYLQQLQFTAPRAKFNYMSKQYDLTWTSRSVLIDWLVSVSQTYNLCDQTFHLSVNYIDRFLSEISMVRTKFQLLGAAAMLIAGKMEEIYPIEAKEWSYLTADTFTVRQVIKMEQLILKVLQFKLQPPTMHTFVQQLCVDNKLDAKTMHLAMYFSELVLLEGEDYLRHLPGELAAAAIALARHTLLKPKPWPKKLKQASGYTLKQLSPVVQKQQITFQHSPLRKEQAIQTKYQSPVYNRVALLKPRALNLLDFDEEE